MQLSIQNIGAWKYPLTNYQDLLTASYKNDPEGPSGMTSVTKCVKVSVRSKLPYLRSNAFCITGTAKMDVARYKRANTAAAVIQVNAYIFSTITTILLNEFELSGSF